MIIDTIICPPEVKTDTLRQIYARERENSEFSKYDSRLNPIKAHRFYSFLRFIIEFGYSFGQRRQGRPHERLYFSFKVDGRLLLLFAATCRTMKSKKTAV